MMCFRAPPGLELPCKPPGLELPCKALPVGATLAMSSSLQPSFGPAVLASKCKKPFVESAGEKSPWKISVDSPNCAESDIKGDSPAFIDNATCARVRPAIREEFRQNPTLLTGRMPCPSRMVCPPSDDCGRLSTASAPPTFPPGILKPTASTPPGNWTAPSLSAKQQKSKPKTKVGSKNTNNGSGAIQIAGCSLMDLLPNLCAVAKDRDGAQFLLAELPKAGKDEQALVFKVALPDAVALSMHEHGHAFMLQVWEAATADQQKVLVEQMSPHIKSLCLDAHGCRVIQRVVQLIPDGLSDRLISGLKENGLQCIKSMHGNHVMQACIDHMPSASVAFIVDAIKDWGAGQASSHMYGCRVVMRLFGRMQPAHIQEVFDQILEAAPKLTQDRYGNYVLQHILQHGEGQARSQMLFKVLECGASQLAMQKYAHNVAEKCIEFAWSREGEAALEDGRTLLLQELLEKEDGLIIEKLASDRFGAKVVTCLLDQLTGSALERLQASLRNAESRLQGLEYAEPVFAKLHSEQ